MKQKAQVSIEYIFIALGVVVMLSIITLSVVSIYSKNITAIDNSSLKNTYYKLKDSFKVSELEPSYKQEIVINTYSDWEIYSKGLSSLVIQNNNKKYTISSMDNVFLSRTILHKNKKYNLVFSKNNNKINIEIEEIK